MTLQSMYVRICVQYTCMHLWNKPGNLGTLEHLTAAREDLTAARDLLVAVSCSLAAVRCFLAAVRCSEVPRFKGFFHLCMYSFTNLYVAFDR